MLTSTNMPAVTEGEMIALFGHKDWASTKLGPMSAWSPALQTALDIALNSRFPMVLWWGPELLMLYNDAWRPVLGTTKHPQFLGGPGREAWPEIWHVIGPMLESVLATGKATWVHDQLLVVNRHNYFEEAYFTYSYSPIHLEDGTVGGVFSAVHETTQQVVSNRRIALLRDLAARVTDADPVENTLSKVIDVFCDNYKDVPFACIYLSDGDSQILKASTPAPLPLELRPEQVPPYDPSDAPFRTVSIESFNLKSPAWNDTVREAIRLPLSASDQSKPIGQILIGINPRRALDDAYFNFLKLLAAQIATAVNSSKAYEQERKRAESLAEIDRAKTVFFSNVSHEFRTPLTLILGPAQAALREGSALNTDEIELIARNARRLLKLVNNLLDFSRIEAGRYQASYIETDIAAFTADIASAFRSTVEAAGLQYDVRCSSRLPRVYVDRDMWEKIVLNLISNAFKYTLHGRIEVTVDSDDRHAGVVLAVSDTGSGIAEEELPAIFERFHRLKNDKARTHEGAGIGLSLVRELVRMHGGSITASSELGKGTVFRVSLPAGKDHLPAAQIQTGESISAFGGQTEQYVAEALRWDGREAACVEPNLLPPAQTATAAANVMVVEDNADMRAYLQRALEPFWNVVTAHNGKQALQAVACSKPDLIITDVMMPEMDGFELIQQIRGNDQTKDLPIIMLSARAGEEARVEGLQRGADDYLVKPFSLKELLAKTNVLLEGQARAADLRRLIDDKTAQLKSIGRILSDFVESGDYRSASAALLELSLQTTASEYGFIGATVAGGPQGTILRVFADRGFNWSLTENRQLYEKIVADYQIKGFVDFPLLDNLFGWPVLNGKPLIANNPSSDPRRSGRQPAGHPPTHNFLGLPVMKGDSVVGLIGLANKVAGFTADDIDNLDHLAQTASVIYEGYRRLQSERSILQERDVAEGNLRKANQSLLDMAYSVSHELQEPLAILRGDLSLLSARYRQRLGTDADQFINNALEANRRISRMIDDLWTFARIDRPHLQFESVDMNELFDKTLIAIENEMSLAGANVRRDRLPVVRAERQEMALVLRQLLVNALQFKRGVAEVSFTARQLVDEWLFCMEDNGIGFDQAEAHEVFKMFRKLDRETPGTGMGLPIARRVIEFHGGRMWAESERYRGSKFYFTLPLVSVR